MNSEPNSWPRRWLCAAALSFCAISAQGQPTAYGQDFVRLGAAWPEGLPGAEQAEQAGPVVDPASGQAYVDQLRELELEQGPYSSGLAEPLDSLGRYYLAQGLHPQAVAMYSRALHVVRINDGLYSQRQLPLLRGLLSAYREAEDWETLDERYAYFFRLLGNGKPPFTELRVRAALEFLRWQREALRLDFPGERRRLLSLINLNEAILDAVSLDIAAPYAWRRDLAFSQLHNLYLLGQRVEARGEKMIVPGPTDYIGAKPLSVDLELQQLDSLLRSAPRRGADLVQQLLPAAALEGTREETAVKLVLADWYFWHGNQQRATEAYHQVVNALSAAGEDELLQAWLGEPVELPDNGVFWQPAETAADAVTVVNARYDITVKGRPRNLEVALVSGSEEASIGGFRRRLAATLFRPRWSTGEAQPALGVSRKYRLLD